MDWFYLKTVFRHSYFLGEKKGGGGGRGGADLFKERIWLFTGGRFLFLFVTAFENTGMTLSIITNNNMELTN